MTIQSAHANPARSLLASLQSGSAGVAIRLLVSLAGALILLAFSSILAYALGAMFPPAWAKSTSGSGYPRGVFVSTEVASVSFSLGGLLFLALLFWVWSRYGRSRGIWIGAGATVGIWAVTIPLCFLIDANTRGDSPFLIGGVACASAGVMVLLWVYFYRRYAGGRAIRDETGVMNLRCPECQYRMVGLKESRCPECGQEYTLDELLSRQDFDALRSGRAADGKQAEPTDHPPPVPTLTKPQ
jgi:hypothetical protein